jgi:NAD(P)-dependent dehydrogenase (short-subunit alcohol dehydrogenase family)
MSKLFDLTGRVAVITGGAGLLGVQHARAIAAMGGVPVLLDLHAQSAVDRAAELQQQYQVPAIGMACDITQEASVAAACAEVLDTCGRVDILINNAANNPKVEGAGLSGKHGSRLEYFPLEVWQQDIAVGLTGAFLCGRIFGAEMARRGRGVILNIASDLALIAPDQRLYRKAGLPEEQQPVKPVTYSVVKAGLLGLTRYLATYWADHGVRCNAICPGGVENGQPAEFLEKLSQLIPIGRMARPEEYQGAIVFLCSDASSYMNGAIVSIDGGRTAW